MIKSKFYQIYESPESSMDQWQENFRWPLSHNDFLSLESDVIGFFYDAIESRTDSALGDFLTVNFKEYISLLNRIYYACLKENNLKQSGSIPTSVKTPSIPQLSVAQKLKHQFRKWYYQLKLYPQGTFVNTPHIFSDISASRQTIRYISKNNIPVNYKLLRNIPLNLSAYDEEFNQKLLPPLEVFLEEMNEFYKKHTSDTVGLGTFFFNEIKKPFRLSYNLYKYYYKRISDNRHLYLGSNNNDWSRALSLAVKNKNGTVYSFSHGEPLVYNWPKISWMDLSLSDIYLEFSDELGDALAQVALSYPPPNKNKYEIRSFPNDEFNQVQKKSTPEKETREIKKVMVIGNAYRHANFSSVTAFPSPVQFHLERQLIEKLLNAGYEVIYQQHPGGIFKKKDIDFKLRGKWQVNREPFEQSIGRADAFLFYYTRTSTFGPAICTSKPIIILDGGWENMYNPIRKDLEGRCQFIDMKINSRNLYEVNVSAMQNFSEAEEKANNPHFFDTYLK